LPASGFGVLPVAAGSLPAPLPVLGIDVFVDPGAGVFVKMQANALGTTSVPFGIPANPAVVGATLCSQFAHLDAACPTGFSATDAMLAIVLPQIGASATAERQLPSANRGMFALRLPGRGPMCCTAVRRTACKRPNVLPDLGFAAQQPVG
jgi:hypothetical protein